MRRALLVVTVVALVLAALILPMGAAQAAEDNPQVGPFGIPVVGTGCTVWTPYVYIGSVPWGPFYIGNGYVSCSP